MDPAILGLGFVLGLSLAAPPGPVLALAAQRAARHGYGSGLVVTLGATTGDAAFAVFMGYGLLALIGHLTWVRIALAFLGSAVLALFAVLAWRSARTPPPDPTQVPEAPHPWGGYLTGMMLALTSPFNFGWWLTAGTTLFGDHGATVFVGFFAGLLTWSVFFVGIVVWTHGRIKGFVRFISYASAVALALFALRMLWVAIGLARATTS